MTPKWTLTIAATTLAVTAFLGRSSCGQVVRPAPLFDLRTANRLTLPETPTEAVPGISQWQAPSRTPETSPARSVLSSPRNFTPPSAPVRNVPSDSVDLRDMEINGVQVGYTPLSEVKTDIRPPDREGDSYLPDDFADSVFGDQPQVAYVPVRPDVLPAVREVPSAAEFAYQPLYFEEANLERYGTHFGVAQPAVSAARFFATVPALPYLTTVHRPRVAYDWYFPYESGRPAPWVRELPPLRLDGSLVEAGAITGLIFLIP